jgi:hypothetical protein
MFAYLVGLFVLVMAGGIALAVLEHRSRTFPLPVSMWHGLLGTVAIVLLVLEAVAHPGVRPVNLAILVFILTAMGGMLLFAFRASRQRLPLAVIVLHGLFAVAGLTLLIAGWSRMR